MEDVEDLRLATMTHARLRAGQGDLQGARVLLARILDRLPAHLPALELLESLQGQHDRAEPLREEPPLQPRLAGEPRELARRFRQRFATAPQAPCGDARVVRLERWLSRIKRVEPSDRGRA